MENRPVIPFVQSNELFRSPDTATSETQTGLLRCTLIVARVTMPKVPPPPPRKAQKMSGFWWSLATTTSPYTAIVNFSTKTPYCKLSRMYLPTFAVTTSNSRTLSTARPSMKLWKLDTPPPWRKPPAAPTVGHSPRRPPIHHGHLLHTSPPESLQRLRSRLGHGLYRSRGPGSCHDTRSASCDGNVSGTSRSHSIVPRYHDRYCEQPSAVDDVAQTSPPLEFGQQTQLPPNTVESGLDDRAHHAENAHDSLVFSATNLPNPAL